MEERCPATMRYTASYGVEIVGVQCKYARGHDGDHAGYAGPGQGDVFWSQAKASDDVASDVDIIREAMAEAQEHPGRIVTR